MENELITFWEYPEVQELYMIAGWQQWADAGAVSSGLPQYLIQKLGAKKIGKLKDADYYLFQLPGTHHFLRPEISLEDGLPKSLRKPVNEFYYVPHGNRGLVIFLGEEPHMRADTYCEALLTAVQMIGVQRVVAVGGVYGAMPYDREREISCIYSLPPMKDELSKYAVRFSNYEGGATIGTYLAEKAQQQEIEFVVLYAFVPAYDFSEVAHTLEALSIEHDFRAWYDLLRRIRHMFGLSLDLSELEEQSHELMISMDAKLEELDEELEDLDVHAYLDSISEEFDTKPFVPPLSDVWGKALDNLLKDEDQDE